jgi:hypothetical protein
MNNSLPLSILPAMILLLIASFTLLLSERWRWQILALAMQYLVVFWLIAQIWPMSLSAVKLVTGWMSAAVLAASQTSTKPSLPITLPQHLFRLFAGLLLLALVITLFPTLQTTLPASPALLFGGLLLGSMGLLQLGITTSPWRVILGLLTLLSGFEILYAMMENSLLVTGLLSLINLSLSLAGAYWLVGPQMEQDR